MQSSRPETQLPQWFPPQGVIGGSGLPELTIDLSSRPRDRRNRSEMPDRMTGKTPDCTSRPWKGTAAWWNGEVETPPCAAPNKREQSRRTSPPRRSPRSTVPPRLAPQRTRSPGQSRARPGFERATPQSPSRPLIVPGGELRCRLAPRDCTYRIDVQTQLVKGCRRGFSDGYSAGVSRLRGLPPSPSDFGSCPGSELELPPRVLGTGKDHERIVQRPSRPNPLH